jgi:hypothetical protein
VDQVIANAIAILLAPLIAVGVGKWRDNRKEKRDRKVWIFRILMATRHAHLTLTERHVEALNMIDLEFRARKEKPVRDAWKVYRDHLNTPRGTGGVANVWDGKVGDLLTELLYEMAKCLGYDDFDKALIRSGCYVPEHFGILNSEASTVRQLLLEVLEGRRSIPIAWPESSARPQLSEAQLLLPGTDEATTQDDE